MEANSGLLSIREPKKLLINSFYKNVFFHKKVSSTRFFNKKVVYKKVLLFWHKSAGLLIMSLGESGPSNCKIYP